MVAQGKNQHYIPQFYFRQFSGGANCIQLFLPAKSQFCRDAPIKSQCSMPYFHGDKFCEEQISKLDDRHAVASRNLIAAAESNDPVSEISVDTLATITEMASVLRARTLLRLEITNSMKSELSIVSFGAYLKSKVDTNTYEDFLRAVDAGQFEFDFSDPATVLWSIGTAIVYSRLISDLDFCLIRNRTNLPFIFCDAPVIFHNTYCHNVKHRGVLGMTTPGLQVFLPLNSQLLLLLYDENTYDCTYSDSAAVDVTDNFDVSQLNALQLHGHRNAVYFSDFDGREYIEQLWSVHSKSLNRQEKFLVEHDDWLLDGNPVKGLLHQFEHLHNIRLDLSFLKCDPISEEDYEPRRRDPELAKETEAIIEREYEAAKQSRRLRQENDT